MDAETRRDAVIEQIVSLGGTVISVEPYATPDNPTVIATYMITAGAPDMTVLNRLKTLKDKSIFMPRSEFVRWENPDAIVGD